VRNGAHTVIVGDHTAGLQEGPIRDVILQQPEPVYSGGPDATDVRRPFRNV
jgi:hypothetical protein